MWTWQCVNGLGLQPKLSIVGMLSITTEVPNEGEEVAN